MPAPRPVDYAEVARVANEALAAGESVYATLMAWSGKPRTTVTNWVTTVRARGLIPPAARPGRPGPGRKPIDPEVLAARRAEAATAKAAAAEARRARLAAQREQVRLDRIAAKERAKAARSSERSRAAAERAAERARARAERLAAKGVQVVVVHTYVPREGVAPAPAVDRSPGPLPAGVVRVLACDDCEFEAPVGRTMDLIRHTVQVHHRQPTRAERTPARVPGMLAS